MENSGFSRLLFPLVLCCTLGLAPFVPEPHIWKQIKNIFAGTFTQPIDWFDLAMHGAPWAYLFFVGFGLINKGAQK